jgi:hypothetical protein
MAKWIVEVKKIERYTVEVEADDYSTARAAALAAPRPADVTVSVSATPRRQIGEPWLCRVEYLDEVQVAVFGRAFGHEFTQADVDLLWRRLERLTYVVRDSWNGVGRDTVSFRIDGKATEDFTADERALLTAPREG